MCQGLDKVIEAIEDININNIHFLFIGDGAEKNLKSLVKEKIKIITFLDSTKKNFAILL